jgi:hypothetical protein
MKNTKMKKVKYISLVMFEVHLVLSIVTFSMGF